MLSAPNEIGTFASSDLAKKVTELNDIYMRFIVDTMVNQLEPNYVVVMGDLFSYQDTTDPEFAERASRYRWIFDSAITRGNIINITGNHDLGYGYEMSRWHVDRFEKEFGLSNFDFLYPIEDDVDNDGTPDTAFITVINNLVLDPSKDQDIRNEVWRYVNKLNPIRLENLHRTSFQKHTLTISALQPRISANIPLFANFPV